jgi:RimJ/RimL family protein N-acetyltransferase
MIVNGFGITLERLTEKDLALVREKRNSKLVAQFMEFQDYITAEMQQEWFNSINNIHNLYYIISYKNKKIGLINGAKIDWIKMETGSGGIFIWEEELWQTTVPLMANLVLMDLSLLFGLKKSFIKVMNDNKRAIQYNLSLGYTVWAADATEKSKIYVLDNARYLEKTKIFRNYLNKNYGETFDLIVDDPESVVTQFLITKVNQMSTINRARLKVIPKADM